jgi:flagellar assembly factor FliW
MRAVSVAERRPESSGARPADEGRTTDANGVALPELSFVHPIPGFTDLRRFVLVRLDENAATDAGSASDAPAVPVPAVPAPALPAAGSVSASVSGLTSGSGESPLYELRSLEQADVRFMVAVPSAFFSDYEIELDDRECGDLGLTASADALVLVMLTVGPDAASTTANLLAPIVINAQTRAAAQIILTGSDWPVRAPLG